MLYFYLNCLYKKINKNYCVNFTFKYIANEKHKFKILLIEIYEEGNYVLSKILNIKIEGFIFLFFL